MILPNCPPSFGQAVAERIRIRVQSMHDSDLARRDGAGHGLASAARSRRSGCARRRCSGSSAPTSSSTAPSPKAATAPASSSRRSRGQRRGEGPAVRHLAVPGLRMSTTSGRDSARRQRRGERRSVQRVHHLAVTSGKGGVGKTFVSANLAAALAERGERVLVLDADLGLANLDVVLNLFPEDHAARRVHRQGALEEAILPAPGGFSVLLAGSGLVEYSRLTPQVRDQLADDHRPARAALRPHPARHRRRHLRRGAVRGLARRRRARHRHARADLDDRRLRDHQGAGDAAEAPPHPDGRQPGQRRRRRADDPQPAPAGRRPLRRAAAQGRGRRRCRWCSSCTGEIPTDPCGARGGAASAACCSTAMPGARRRPQAIIAARGARQRA